MANTILYETVLILVMLFAIVGFVLSIYCYTNMITTDKVTEDITSNNAALSAALANQFSSFVTTVVGPTGSPGLITYTGASGPGVTELSQLSDVRITTPIADGSILSYVGPTGGTGSGAWNNFQVYRVGGQTPAVEVVNASGNAVYNTQGDYNYITLTLADNTFLVMVTATITIRSSNTTTDLIYIVPPVQPVLSVINASLTQISGISVTISQSIGTVPTLQYLPVIISGTSNGAFIINTYVPTLNASINLTSGNITANPASFTFSATYITSTNPP